MNELEGFAGRRFAGLELAVPAGSVGSSVTGSAVWNWNPLSSVAV